MIETEAPTPLARWMKVYQETDMTVSEKLALSRVQVSRLRRNLCKASPETALKLEKLTGLPASTFIFGD